MYQSKLFVWYSLTRLEKLYNILIWLQIYFYILYSFVLLSILHLYACHKQVNILAISIVYSEDFWTIPRKKNLTDLIYRLIITIILICRKSFATIFLDQDYISHLATLQGHHYIEN